MAGARKSTFWPHFTFVQKLMSKIVAVSIVEGLTTSIKKGSLKLTPRQLCRETGKGKQPICN